MNNFFNKSEQERKRLQENLKLTYSHIETGTQTSESIRKGIPANPTDRFKQSLEMTYLEKGGKAGVAGEVRTWNGKKYKKQANGKWMQVSESHGMTKKEHKQESLVFDNKASSIYNEKGSSRYNTYLENRDKHDEAVKQLSDKEYDESELSGGGKSKQHQEVADYFSEAGIELTDKFNLESFADSIDESPETATTLLCNLEDQDVMTDIANGDYKSFNLYDEDQFNDMYDYMYDDLFGGEMNDDIEKGGAGSRGGKVIGYTKSGKPIYKTFDHESHKDFSKEDHSDAAHIHAKAYHKHGGKFMNFGTNEKPMLHHREQTDKHLDAAGKKGVYINTDGKEILKSYSSDILEKAKVGAPVGTIKKMGGREYIKAPDGTWKYHGKGGGAKAQEHSTAVHKEKTENPSTHSESEKMAAEKMNDINHRFKAFAMFTNQVIKGKSKSLIAYGTGGVGKTYTVTRQLKAAGLMPFDDEEHAPGEDSYDYVKITGKMTAPQVYKTMYEHNGKIILFDDCDSVLRDGSAINLFKGALDTSGDGTIAYGTSAGVKGEENADGESTKIPKRFKFHGKVIFISNLPPDNVPQPLKSRALKVDLTMTKQQTIDRIREIATNPKTGQYTELVFPGIDKYSHKDLSDVIDYLEQNKDHIGDLNVRTVGKMLGIKQEAAEMGEKNWEVFADQELFSKGGSTNDFYNGGAMRMAKSRIASMYKGMRKPMTYKSEDVKSAYYHEDEDPDVLKKNLTKGGVQKSYSSDILEKGGKRAQVGEVRVWGGKKYQRTMDGWTEMTEGHQVGQQQEPAGKTKGKPKDAAQQGAMPQESTPESHATNTPTDHLKKFVADKNADPKLKEVAQKELEKRGHGDLHEDDEKSLSEHTGKGDDSFTSEKKEGGKVIGHTKSGKYIYKPNAMRSNQDYNKHRERVSDYTNEDHKDAMNFHKKQQSFHTTKALEAMRDGKSSVSQNHSREAGKHFAVSEYHRVQSGESVVKKQ